MAGLNKTVAEVRPEKSCSAGNQDPLRQRWAVRSSGR
jgi:hypothetical protein